MQQSGDAWQVGIIGLGYVGLKELVAFSSKKTKVVGYDISCAKISLLNQLSSPIGTVTDAEIRLAVDQGCIFTADPSLLRHCEFIIIAVPTPINSSNDPDLTYIESAFNSIEKFFDPTQQIIVVESTTYPGCSREMVNKYFPGQDVDFAFCGEREDPGGQCPFANIPRVLGASSPAALTRTKRLYENIVIKVHEVSSPEVAEITKLYENVYRSVNIGLANEFKVLCHRMGLDPYEVINAAKTKPFGFRAFYPGPGLGGHCIPIDPFYLAWAAKRYDYNMQFIELSGIINSQMPRYVVTRVIEALNQQKKPVNGSHILICGVSYKRDVEDTRNSPAETIIQRLTELGAEIDIYDPVVAAYTDTYLSIDVQHKLNSSRLYDTSLILTDHTSLDRASIVSSSRVVVDTRGFMPASTQVMSA
jgi:UDP-N-acetyl-D-glucosamine dehydrogenase